MKWKRLKKALTYCIIAAMIIANNDAAYAMTTQESITEEEKNSVGNSLVESASPEETSQNKGNTNEPEVTEQANVPEVTEEPSVSELPEDAEITEEPSVSELPEDIDITEEPSVSEIPDLLSKENKLEAYAGTLVGEGTAASPYIISSGSELSMLADNLSAYYVLSNDIDLKGTEWTPVGTSSKPFTGHFDGNGFSISNFNVTSTGSYAGFFGYTTNAGFSNLTLNGITVSGTDCVGGLAGYAGGSSGSVTDCHVLNSAITGSSNAGGLIGYCGNTLTITITGCSSDAEVKATAGTAGGLTAYGYAGFRECFFTGKVSATGGRAGGITGLAYQGTYNQCYSTGEVEASGYAGGIVAYGNSSSIVVQNCFVLGSITGKSSTYVGGIIGRSGSCTIRTSYCAAQLSGTAGNVYGICGGSVSIVNSYYDAEASGLTNTISSDIDRLTAAMVSQVNYKSWNFDTIWSIDEGSGYPYLQGMDKPYEVGVGALSISGSGTQASPYEIHTAEQLNLLRYHMSGWYELENSLDLGGADWIPVGTSSKPFSGHFDGKGYSISNFNVTSTGSYAGFFGYTTNAGFSNLTLNGITVSGTDCVGGLAGYAGGSSGSVTDCHVLNSAITGSSNAGGLIGYCSNTLTITITGCSSNAEVKATAGTAGGLTAYGYAGFRECFFTGKVSATGGRAGGITGLAYQGTYNQCYSTGEVEASGYAGGIVAYGNSSSIVVQNCFVLGSITGKSSTYVGGIIGRSGSCTIRNSYSAAQLSGAAGCLYGINGGTASVVNSYYDAETCGLNNTTSADIDRLTASMISKSNYKNWNFDTVWALEEGSSYPYLQGMERPSEAFMTFRSIDGAGTQENPFIITNVKQLELLSYQLSAWFELAVDINLNGSEWTPVGTSNKPFSGHLNGNGHTISNFSITSTTSYTGFFGYTMNAEFSNLTLNNMIINGTDCVGSLAGYAGGSASIITGCHITNAQIIGGSNVGGLIGYGSNTLTITIAECSSDAEVKATGGTAGGLLAYSYAGFRECFFTGKVSATGGRAGGITGLAYQGAYNQCYSTGEVEASGYAGGIVGYGNSSSIVVQNCFVLGSITGKGSTYVGGIIGRSGSCTIRTSYSAANLSGAAGCLYGIYGGTATVVNSYYNAEITGIMSTTANNMDRLTSGMLTSENYTGWDFDNVWTLSQGQSYPYLRGMTMPSAVRVTSVSIQGYGTEASPYIITNRAQLEFMRYHLSAWFVLAVDIDLEGAEWLPIGTSGSPFTGRFDGQNHVISNFKITSTTDFTGFFAATNGAKISNLYMKKFTVTGVNYTGGLIGRAEGTSSSLYNCHLSEAVISGNSYVGGFAGSYSGSMSRCTFSGTINATGNYCGGAAGYAPVGGDYSDCEIHGSVTGKGYVGGVTGSQGGRVSVTGSRVSVVVSGTGHTGVYTGNGTNFSESGNTFSGISGSGTASDPYVVHGTDGLHYIGNDPDGHYTLGGNIDGGGSSIAPIGTLNHPFTGTFNGGGHTISNIHVTGGGLFGHTSGGTITNIHVDHITIDHGGTGDTSDPDYTGGLVDYAEGECITFIDCHITNTTINAKSYVGSLIGGCNGKVIIEDCSSDAVINAGGSYIGGLAGFANTETKRSYFNGTIQATGDYVGGLVGYANGGSYEESYASAEITGRNYVGGLAGGKSSAGLSFLNCYGAGSFTGTSYIGGIIGRSTGSATLKNVYAAAKMKGTSHIGGLEGDNANISVTSCYYDMRVSMLTDTTGWGRTTSVMLYKNNFIDWSFGDIWYIIEGQTYPYLREMEMPQHVDLSDATGRTVNATTGAAVNGLTVKLRAGADNKTGAVISTLTTDANGRFTFGSLAYGSYTLEVSGDGYVTNYVTITISAENQQLGDIAMVPVTTGNKMTIVLTWGQNPADLDSHFTDGSKEVSYENLEEPGIKLDLDDTSSYGPETITIDFDTVPSNTYRYFVRWFRGSGTWGTSEAKVCVYMNNQKIREFSVPGSIAGNSSGDWNVFTLNSATKTITAN